MFCLSYLLFLSFVILVWLELRSSSIIKYELILEAARVFEVGYMFLQGCLLSFGLHHFSKFSEKSGEFVLISF